MDRDRMQWKGKLEYLFTCFGYTVGLGNIWRFPYKCYIHGGGAFIIPYLITVVLCAFPILSLEMFMGQFSSEGPITVWKFCPLFKGVGWAIIFNIFMTNVNYIVIVMYSFYYMLVAFVNIGGPLPWQKCQKAWATPQCRDEPFPDYEVIKDEMQKINTLQHFMDDACVQRVRDKLNGSTDPDLFSEFRAMYKSCEIQYHSPEEEYWNRFVLGVHESDGLDDLGPVVGRNALTLLLVWLIVFYCCVRGIRQLAKVIYFTASFPFLVLLILLVRGMTLEGHEIGIKFYTEPDYGRLSNMAIWSSAATQAMYSIGVAFGSHIALASHNKFDHRVFRDAVILGSVNTITSICGGFVVFAFLGHASFIHNRPIDKIFDQGPGIIFISYLQGISQLPGSAVWAFMFFMVVLTLGVDVVFIMVWTVYVAIEDVFPATFKKKGTLILVAMCIVPYLLGLPLMTNGGIHLLVVMDRYTADFTLTLFLIMESVAICWVYGLRRFISDVEMMIGRKSRIFKWYLMATWGVTAPAFGMFIFIASAVGYTSVSYNGIQTTAGGEAYGWILIVTPLLIMLGVAAYQIRKNKGDATIAALRKKVCELTHIKDEDLRVLYCSKELRAEDDHGKTQTLGDYGIVNEANLFVVLRLLGGSETETEPPKMYDSEVQLTDKPDMFTLDDEEGGQRAEMPCGHAIGPESLTAYCRSLLSAGKYEFRCPYKKSPNDPFCDQLWEFFTVKRLAVLTSAELKEFDTKITENYLRKAVGIRECPSCQSFCERKHKQDQRVIFPICTRKKGKLYEFCWFCLKTWLTSDTKYCGNFGCTGKDPRLRILENCPKQVVVEVPNCPAVRACPTCGLLIEHKEACNQMKCPCDQKFCFICLKKADSAGKYQCGTWNFKCEVAPVQTTIAGM